jgi:antitoxin component YwqK of YwqJK toxin-antitoxin module
VKSIYRSSIPKDCNEKIVSRHPDGSKSVCHYFKNRKKVGVRFFDDDGSMSMEFGINNGLEHGNHYEWISGKLVFFQKIKNGLAYGTAKQWSESGKLIGSFKMNNGNGIDLWWQDWSGQVHLSEVCFLKNGLPHGVEWALDQNETIFNERQWFNGNWHGVYRSWKNSGTLSEGFPKFFIMNKQVAKAQYLKACKTDPTLPMYKTADDRAYREFPKSLKPHLRRKKH